MKNLILLLLFSLSATFAHASCDEEVTKFFLRVAPKKQEIVVTGKYTKESERTGQYLNCEIAIKRSAGGLTPNLDPTKFNPAYGDGGAFWPFGSYPTVEPGSNDYQSVNYFSCSADENGFSMDYSYREIGGWYKTKRYSLSVLKNTDGSYDVSLRDGESDFDAVTCRGALSNKE